MNFVVLFDELANDCLQSNQMDVHVKCWDSAHKVTARYYTSVFMGHSIADDIEEKLLSTLEPAKIIQISMDGPNVNLKFFRGLQEHLQQNYQVQCVDLGTCGLHTSLIGRELQRLNGDLIACFPQSERTF